MDEKTKLITIPFWARVLAALGAINCAGIGWFGENILHLLFSKWIFLSKIISIIIGIAGIYLLATIRREKLY